MTVNGDGYRRLALLKNELLCLGARASEGVAKGRKGGAGPAGGNYFLLPGGVCVNIPLQGPFVEGSPFEIVKSGGRWILLRNGAPYEAVDAVERPRFYEKSTSDGVPMWKIALLHGKDCLASTVYQRCYYWRLKRACAFCAIELSLAYGSTIEFKSPKQLAEVALEAFKEGVVNHVTLTTGTPPSPDKGVSMLVGAARAIKKATKLPVHVQLEPPGDLKALEALAEAGVDTVGIHIESFDEGVLASVCPMKADVQSFLKAWDTAVDIFGEAQVSTYLIAGLGENERSVIKGAELLIRMGVIPFLVPLRPLIGTPLESVSPPPPERMLRLYEVVCQTLKTYGLNPMKNKAGCVRCGACSALNEFYKLCHSGSDNS